jgi:cytochrome c-type biogenesis protein CcmH
VIAVGLALAASLGLYRYLGAPGLEDRPIARRIAEAEALRRDRPDQAAAEAEALAAGALPAISEPDPAYGELIGRLREAVAERPDDLQGQQLLMRHEAGLGNFAAASAAQARVVALMGDEASADDYAALAELQVMAAAGYVAPEAEAALAAALARDPGHGSARYYLGLLEAQTGRPDRAFRLWRDLLEEGPETAPWVAPVREQIDLLAAAAGVRYQPPEALQPPETLAGPDADAIAAAGAMSAEDRDAMIRGMVDRLGTRLAEAGGTPAEWARLINALGVLGETENARAVYAEARGSFAGQDAALAELRVAAEAAGVAE